jgi:cytochrome oxidase Cu insertion factor (SCO1/SenC/PrrC family)
MRMKPERLVKTSLGWIVIGPLIAVAVLLASLAAQAVEEDVRNLLQALWIDTPSGPVIAPSFSLPDVTGAPVRLADHKGRIVMLYFWTTW